jgi:hypothetical protein
MENFYVYSHIRKDTGKCFYIGKGSGKRAYLDKFRNQYWRNVVNKHGFEVIILINNISEQKAFEYESIFCKEIGYENLTNIRKENGWGGYKQSQETKDKISKANTGKIHSQETKNIISNIMKGNTNRKGKKNSQQTINKISQNSKGITRNNKKIIDTTTGIIYNSIKEIADIFQINYGTLSCKLTGHNSKGNNTNFKYYDEK